MIELNKIYNEDCIRGMNSIPDKSIDFVILDPDYNEWDMFCESGLIDIAKRVLKDSGNMICFTKQPFDYNLRIAINDIFRREFCWTFTNGGAWVSNKMPLVSFQKIYWCTPHKDFYFSPRTGLEYDDKTKDFKRKEKVFEGYKEEGRTFVKSSEGLWMRDHYHYNKPLMGSIPAKPLELIEIFIRCLCPENGIVLDPFAGSGTTAIAAKKNNRAFIGYELDKERFEIANKRIQKELLNTTLFDI